MLIEKDEGTAARRRIPFRLFTSNGTAPDTGASNDSVVMAVNSATTIIPNVLVTAAHAAQGMYYVTLSQSNVSVLGTHALYHTQGDFTQHVANFNVVNFNPYSTQSNDLSLRPTTAGRTLDVTATGAAGVDWGNVENQATQVDLSLTTLRGIDLVSSTLAVNATQISGDATAADNLEAAFDGTGYNSNLTVFVKDSVATITGVTNIATDVAAVKSDTAAILVDTSTTLDGKIDTIGTNVDSILVDTAEIGAAGAGLTDLGGMSTTMKGQVNAEADTALTDYDAPTRAELTTDINSILTKLNALVLASGTIGSTGNDTTHLHLDGLTYGNDELNDHLIVVFDNSTSEYHSVWITDYTGATDLAEIETLPFTPEDATDTYWVTSIKKEGALTPTTAGRTLDVTTGGAAGIDWANVENPTTEVNLSNTTVKGVADAVSVTGTPDVNAVQISGDATAADNLEAAFDGTGYNSNLTVFVKDSIATIAGVTNIATDIAALNDIDGSAVTIHDGGIGASAFQAGAVDGAAIADDAGHEIADQLLARDIDGGSDGGRSVTDAFRSLRNRTQLSAVSYIVYQEDDTTVAWHASLSTTGNSVFPTDINPD